MDATSTILPPREYGDKSPHYEPFRFVAAQFIADVGMTEDNSLRVPSEVAMWHQLSGTPDNVTEEGEVVEGSPALRMRSEKESLRAAIESLRAAHLPEEVRSTARLAASYQLAGDMETAARYVTIARDRLGNQRLEEGA
jgi:hypothetical protein